MRYLLRFNENNKDIKDNIKNLLLSMIDNGLEVIIRNDISRVTIVGKFNLKYFWNDIKTLNDYLGINNINMESYLLDGVSLRIERFEKLQNYYSYCYVKKSFSIKYNIGI